MLFGQESKAQLEVSHCHKYNHDIAGSSHVTNQKGKKRIILFD